MALGGCAFVPWFGTADDKVSETADETQLQRQVPPPPEPDSGIAIGGEGYDKQYASLAAAGVALAPPDTGYFIDVHEARLRQVLTDTPIRMQRKEGRLQLIVPGNMSFGTNSAEIMAEIQPVLRDIAVVLVEFDKTLVSIHGHTDDRGDSAYNWALSERRAVAVALYLARHGVAKERLVGIGHGEEQPVTERDTEEARAANRRIEIRIELVVTKRKVET
jgi:outer membrane protein OmpA-like peptidoglycan-associated protein